MKQTTKLKNPMKNEFVKFSLETVRKNPTMVWEQYKNEMKKTKEILNDAQRLKMKKYMNDTLYDLMVDLRDVMKAREKYISLCDEYIEYFNYNDVLKDKYKKGERK